MSAVGNPALCLFLYKFIFTINIINCCRKDKSSVFSRHNSPAAICNWESFSVMPRVVDIFVVNTATENRAA